MNTVAINCGIGLHRGTGFQPVACVLARTRRSRVKRSRSDLPIIDATAPLAAASCIGLNSTSSVVSRPICLSTGITGWKPEPQGSTGATGEAPVPRRKRTLSARGLS